MTAPVHPSLVPVYPQRYTAEVQVHDGRWFHYAVYRLHGIGIPERCFTYHRTLKGAERSARKWAAQDKRTKPQTLCMFSEPAQDGPQPTTIVRTHKYAEPLGHTTTSHGCW